MRLRTGCLPLVAFALAAALAGGPSAFAPPCHAALVLSEILADPARDWDGDGVVDSRDDEWVELLNDGAETIDLADYYLRDALGSEAQIRLGGALAPGAVTVVFGSDAAAWQAAVGLSVTGLSLNNAGDTLYLDRGDPAQDGAQLVDVYIYDDHEAEDDRASGRLPGGEWALFDYYYPYSGSLLPAGTGCAPSPGAPNLCVPNVPADGQSWGAVKSDYR